MAQWVKNLPAMQETWVQVLGGEDPLEQSMALHSSILAWKIPWTESLAGYGPWGRKESDTTKRLKQWALVCLAVRNTIIIKTPTVSSGSLIQRSWEGLCLCLYKRGWPQCTVSSCDHINLHKSLVGTYNREKVEAVTEFIFLDSKMKLQYVGHQRWPMSLWRANSLEKTLMLGKIEGKRRRGQQRMRW